ncbi:hypothetical protein L6452_27117 [Arctium lappa]|uniref:Uncharacterized protein n=1 Tax=Arctium lappa TaxID=4217 RepID=A0ACB8ZVQ5_ARCLA|nr:hypothetical protein L6452_27117 [Arctium lappa]
MELKKSEAVIMDEWRNNLTINGNADILFDFIERAIMVAASDHPMEFRLKRDKIAQTLFSLNCCDDHVEEGNVGRKQSMKVVDGPKVDNHHRHTFINYTSHEDSTEEEDLVHEGNVGCKQSMKVQDSNVNNHRWEWDSINYSSSNHGDTSTEEDLVHQETKMVAEVLKMKEILDKSSCTGDDKSESLIIYSSLSKLQEMGGMSFKALEETKIGRSVNRFQKHGWSDVRQIARSLIKKWRGVVDEYIKATENNTSSCVVQEQEEEEKKKEMVSMGMKKESGTSNGKTGVMKIKIIRRNSEKAKMDDSQDEMRRSVVSIEKKLEASKRKLHQRYEEAENAKRQRKIQVIQPHQLKKQGLVVPQVRNRNRKYY